MKAYIAKYPYSSFINIFQFKMFNKNVPSIIYYKRKNMIGKYVRKRDVTIQNFK